MTFVAYANATVTNGPTTKDVTIFHILKNSGIVDDVNGKVVDIRNNQTLQVGDQIYLAFVDGFDTTYTAKAGDNPWAVTGMLLDNLEPVHGSANVDSAANQQKAQVPPIPVPTPTVWQSASTPWWVWALFIVFALSVLSYLFRAQLKQGWQWLTTKQEPKRPRTDNPVTAGPAFDSNGVNQTNLEQSAQAAAQRQHPGARIVPGTIQAGFLSGTGRVHFSDGRNELFTLNRQRGYQAQAQLPNGELRMIQFLQGCANDVTYGGRYYAGLTFEVETVTTTESAANSATPAVTNTTVSALTQIAEVLKQMPNGGTIVVADGTIAVIANEKQPEFNLHLFTHQLNGKVKQPAEEQKA